MQEGSGAMLLVDTRLTTLGVCNVRLRLELNKQSTSDPCQRKGVLHPALVVCLIVDHSRRCWYISGDLYALLGASPCASADELKKVRSYKNCEHNLWVVLTACNVVIGLHWFGSTLSSRS